MGQFIRFCSRFAILGQPPSVNAVGSDIYSLWRASTISIEVIDELCHIQTINVDSTTGYFGLIATGGYISSVTYASLTDQAEGVDNFYFGSVDPVPEPATMLLFGTGLAALAGNRIRRKKK